jgi:hypothetical protein
MSTTPSRLVVGLTSCTINPETIAFDPIFTCAILAARHALYSRARELNPGRWSGDTRNWSPIGAVTLNPERDSIIKSHSAGNDIQPLAA